MMVISQAHNNAADLPRRDLAARRRLFYRDGDDVPDIPGLAARLDALRELRARVVRDLRHGRVYVCERAWVCVCVCV